MQTKETTKQKGEIDIQTKEIEEQAKRDYDSLFDCNIK